MVAVGGRGVGVASEDTSGSPPARSQGGGDGRAEEKGAFAGGIAPTTDKAAEADEAAFRREWEDLMRRALALQGAMQRFGLQLATTPPGRGAHVELARARALGKQLLSHSLL